LDSRDIEDEGEGGVKDNHGRSKEMMMSFIGRGTLEEAHI
jgi:hypothetical protein